MNAIRSLACPPIITAAGDKAGRRFSGQRAERLGLSSARRPELHWH